MVEILELTVSPEAALWAVLGFMFARAFGKRVDFEITDSLWFVNLQQTKPVLANLISRFLDFFHHFYVGLALWFYAPRYNLPTGFDMPLQFLGLGLFIDDLPDVPSRFRGYFSYFIQPFEEKGDLKEEKKNGV